MKEKFGDVKFFCAGGSASRMRLFAAKAAERLSRVRANPPNPQTCLARSDHSHFAHCCR